MPTTYTPLLGLALPVTGELSGTWGDTVNDYITQYLDAAVAGTQTISGSLTAVTLSKTTGGVLSQAGSGATGSSQYQVINCTGNPAGTLTITAPAASKAYLIINATSTSQDVKIVGAGPTTGVTLVSGERAIVSWNGSDFVKVANFGGGGSFTTISATTGNITTVNATTVDTTNLEVTNIKAKDGTASASIADATGVVSFSANPVLSSGTANGVLYLNGSKVATSGSALTFDGGTFGVVGSTGGSGAIAAFTTVDNPAAGRDFLRFVRQSGGTAGSIEYSEANSLGVNSTTATLFKIGGSEQMRLTSTGLGIGTSSPVVKLDVVGSGQTISRIKGGTGTNQGSAFYVNQAGSSNTLSAFGDRAAILGGTPDQAVSIFTFGGLPLLFDISGSERMRLDSSGNLGLGVTPSAWNANYKALQFPSGGIGAFITASVAYAQNAYDSGVGAWKYMNTGAAGFYNQSGGAHAWFTAPSGTAGNPISFGDPKMTLTQGGNLLVGTTSSPAYGSKLRVEGGIETFSTQFNAASGTSTQFELVNRSASAGFDFYVNSGGTLAARITSGGDLLVGTTANTNFYRVVSESTGAVNGIQHRDTAASGSTANAFQSRFTQAAGTTYSHFSCAAAGTEVFRILGNGNVQNTNNSYGAISDLKLKENITDATPKLAGLMGVRVVNYNLKSDPDHKQIGVIAQELEQIFPGMVEETPDRDVDGELTGETTKAVKYSVFVPMLIKALQEQQALITDLTTRVAALEAT